MTGNGPGGWKAVARDAHRHADALERELLARHPDVWHNMDRLRADPPGRWPRWCLVPMAASIASLAGPGHRHGDGLVPHIAQASALYAWRFARSVWVVEPALMGRLLAQVPDTLGVDELAGLPEWCVYVAGGHPEWPGSGLWIHLEHDYGTGRPELRLMLDLGGGLDDLLPIPVYLDRPSVTEALADMRATARASLRRAGANVRGGDLDAGVAFFADRVDAYLSVAAYLARPEADVRSADRPGVRPVRPRSPVRGRSTWLVGYGDVPLSPTSG